MDANATDRTRLIDGPPQPMQIGRETTGYERLDIALADVDQAIDELCNRLNPLLRHEGPVPAVAMLEQEPRSHVDGLAYRANRLRCRLVDLLDRLDV